MSIYLILLGFVIIVALVINIVFPKSKEKLKKILFTILIFIALFSVMGLRDKSVGVDTELYCKIFTNFTSGNVNDSNFDTSKIYVHYNILVGKLLGTDSRNIIIANSFIIILLFCIFNNKSSPNIYISAILYILLYFYLQSFNIARQFIAILLSAISIRYVINKDIKKYLLLNILAIFIHNTAIFIAIIGLIIMKIKKINLKKIIYLMIGTAISTVLLDKVIAIFLILFPKYTSYFTTNDIFYESGQGRKILIILVYTLFLVIGLYVAEKKKYETDENKYREYMIYSTLVMFACVIGTIGMKSTLIGRVSFYFEIFLIPYIPMVVEKINKRKEIWYFIIISIFFISFFIQLSGNISGVVPYEFYE